MKVKSLQRALIEVSDILHNTLVAKHIEASSEQRAKVVVKSFDDEFTNFLNVVESKTQFYYDANLFSTIFQKNWNDLPSLDTCIKELWRCQQVGKVLYIKCTLSHKLIKYLDSKIQGKLSGLQALTSQIQQPSYKVDEVKGQVVSVHTDVRKLQFEKKKVLRRLLEFKESISLKISVIER